jgi:hypothetical protein
MHRDHVVRRTLMQMRDGRHTPPTDSLRTHVNVNRRTRITAAAAVCLLSRGASAQARPASPSPIGVWRGTSLCLVRPSPCNDEIVVYRITRAAAGDSLSVDGRKIVNGHEEEMGVLGCQLTVQDAQIRCAMPSGTWRFTLRGDSLVGELRLRDSTKYRDVRTARSR